MGLISSIGARAKTRIERGSADIDAEEGIANWSGDDTVDNSKVLRRPMRASQATVVGEKKGRTGTMTRGENYCGSDCHRSR